MSNDFLYLRHWITGEGYGPDCPARPVILECIRSRSGMSMGVYDRGERIFTVNGCGFDRIGTALGDFLETCFQPELFAAPSHPARKVKFHPQHIAPVRVSLEGATGVNSIIEVANAIGLSVSLSESKAGTLIIISKKGQ